jgi:hypothetical protein
LVPRAELWTLGRSPMSATHIQTKSLKLVPQTLEEVRPSTFNPQPSTKWSA